MIYRIHRPSGALDVMLRLPASKSISNRLLVIQALAGKVDSIENLSDSDDTDLMLKALNSRGSIKNVGHAGTTMRFLTAYYSIRDGMTELWGSKRMHERPIGPLVDALNRLGAKIVYLEKKGFPPLAIEGGRFPGGTIDIDSSISSQFISALLIIGPYMEKGLKLKLVGGMVSASYIEMTLELMAQQGVDYRWRGKTIHVNPGSYSGENCVVESDWSAAAFWYSMAFLDKNSSVHLSHLQKNSLQGDSVLADIFEKLGMKSSFSASKVILEKGLVARDSLFEYDFTNCPDLVQALAVCLCLSDIPFRFTGTKTLRIKETDRIAALQTELGKLGFNLESDEGGSFLSWSGKEYEQITSPVISTYHDHRMAMAFAPVALKRGEILIEDPLVVSKSYPGFWEDLQDAGFIISGL